MLNGQCSGICGGDSFREERLILADRGRNGGFKKEMMMTMMMIIIIIIIYF